MRRATRTAPRSGLPIGPAAHQLGTTPRMLRYREALGLLGADRRDGEQRRYRGRELAAAAFAISLEQRYAVSPRALAFALRARFDPDVAADLHRLAELVDARSPLAVLDFEQEKARRLLRLAG